MGDVIHISGFHRYADRYIDRVSMFRDPKSNLLFVQPVITTVAIFSQRGDTAVQNKACPVKIYIGVLKQIPGKYSVLQSGDDECAVFTEDFQKTIQCLFCERREVVPFPGFGQHEPRVSMFDAEVVAEFVGGEGFDQGEYVDSFLFQRGEEDQSEKICGEWA